MKTIISNAIDHVDFDIQFCDVVTIRQIISGELSPHYLWKAFWFDLTEEGYNYWKHVQESEFLSNTARKKLLEMIRGY